MLGQYVFHFTGENFESPYYNHVLCPVNKLDVAFVVHNAHITGVHVSITVDGLCGGFGFVEISFHDKGAIDTHLSRFAQGNVFS